MSDEIEEVKSETDDKSSAIDKLNNNINTLLATIIDENDPDKLKDLTSMFNQNMMKKNLVRSFKLNQLIEEINNVAQERVTYFSDTISNQDINNYMKSVSSEMQATQACIDAAKQEPMIQVNKQTNMNINVNGTELSRDERERIIDVVNKIVDNVKNESDDNIIDATITSEEQRKDNDSQ